MEDKILVCAYVLFYFVFHYLWTIGVRRWCTWIVSLNEVLLEGQEIPSSLESRKIRLNKGILIRRVNPNLVKTVTTTQNITGSIDIQKEAHENEILFQSSFERSF